MYSGTTTGIDDYTHRPHEPWQAPSRSMSSINQSLGHKNANTRSQQQASGHAQLHSCVTTRPKSSAPLGDDGLYYTGHATGTFNMEDVLLTWQYATGSPYNTAGQRLM